MKPPRLLTHAAAGSPGAALTWHPAWQGEFQHIYLFACLRADLYLLYTGSLSCRERARVRPCAHVACAVVSGIHRQGRRGSRGRLTPRRRPGVRGHHVARCQRQPGVHRPARGRRAAGRLGVATTSSGSVLRLSRRAKLDGWPGGTRINVPLDYRDRAAGHIKLGFEWYPATSGHRGPEPSSPSRVAPASRPRTTRRLPRDLLRPLAGATCCWSTCGAPELPRPSCAGVQN